LEKSLICLLNAQEPAISQNSWFVLRKFNNE
jgi:hypothetical protein